MAVFIDWLSIYQDYEPGSLPLIGDEFRVFCDLATGEIKKEVVTGYQHQGSFDTSIRVRCDGTSVEVSGNPSSFGRVENFSGVLSVQAAIDIYNTVLESVGLPPFQDREINYLAPLQYQSGEGHYSGNPVITRIDLTENFETVDVLMTLRHLSGYRHQGKCGYLYPNGRTVDWQGSSKAGTGSKRVYVKYYCKAHDLQSRLSELKNLLNQSERENLKGSLHQFEVSGSVDLSDSIEYLEKLLEWTRAHNIVRHEVSFKSRQLKRLGLQRIGAWTLELSESAMSTYRFHEKIKSEGVDFSKVAERLIELGIDERQAHRADNVFRAWIQGKNMHFSTGALGKSTYYVIRKQLLLCGVDIANPCDISVLPIKSVPVRLKAVAPPDFYRFVGRAA